MHPITLTLLLPLLSLTSCSPVVLTTNPIIESRQLASSDTENDILSNAACKAVTILFARGTFESGNVGTLVGPPFFSAVASRTTAANLAVQGVDYPADVEGFFGGGDKNGSMTMAALVGRTMGQCPETKVVLGGYSQGGQLVHNAAKLLTPTQAASINSVVIFGDPENGTAVAQIPASRVLVICHTGDNICAGGDFIGPAHLNYNMDAGTAAAFVATEAGY